MPNFIKEDLVELLRNNVLRVAFEKADGTMRVMKCTLNFENIPEEARPNSDKEPPKSNENVVRVFDLEIGEWRSFRLDSVDSYAIE